MTTSQVGWAVGLVIFGYLAGSVSPSVFLGRAFKGLDVRQHGSGNAGTTNAFRVLGVRLGVAVLVCDILKGVIPVALARQFTSPVVTVIVALAAVLGHNYSVFLRGKGGKGVATGAGVAIAMMPLPAVCVVAVFVVILLISRTVSISSLVGAVLLPVFAAVFREPLPYIVIACLLALVVVWGHRGNIGRLRERTEPRINLRWRSRPAKNPGEDMSSNSDRETAR